MMSIDLEVQKVTKDLLVAVSLALHFPQDVDAVVIAEGPRHLVVVHGQVILLDAPQLGKA